MKNKLYWHKLDNAAKIFPATSKRKRSNVFRISYYLDETVDPIVLEEALNLSLQRFETFAVQLKNGLFWNYLSENKKRAKVYPESSQLCDYFTGSQSRGYLFKLYYLNNKISLETFHALSDGTGALAFLNAIVYKYFTLQGFDIPHENKIIGELPFSQSETVDMFEKNYDKSKKRNLSEAKAYHLSGDTFADDWNMLFKIKLNKQQALTLVKEKYQTSLTKYITAVIAYAVYEEGLHAKGNKRPIKIVVPVNLRPFFETNTLRNFSLFVSGVYDPKINWTFASMLEKTELDFQDQLQKDKLHERVCFNVGFEKNVFIRILPLVLKTLAFKIGYYLLGSSIHTISFSNLGSLDIPKALENKILDADFITAGTGITGSILSIKEDINICFTSIFKNMGVLGKIVSLLKQDGLDITIDTNYKEEYDEIL